jgi:DNA-binding transcriptional ArsR family regulator
MHLKEGGLIMEEQTESGTVIIEDSDFVKELSEYLDVLSSDVRLKILKLVEKEPKDARTIASDIETTYENTKRHLDKLLNIGVIRKEIGLGRETVKGIHPVWKYSLVTGGLEAILRNLGIFSNLKFILIDRVETVKGRISEEFMSNFPMIKVLGGQDDGKVFLIKKESVRIGRIDPKNQDQYDPENDIVLSGEYKAVTRVSKPHAKLTLEGSVWDIEDCESTGGTYLNNRKLDKYRMTKLNDGDMVGLSRGVLGALLLFTLPSE